MNIPFVDMRTVYSDPSERNLKYLESVYHNPDKLNIVISDLIEKNIGEELIRDKRILIKPNWVLHNRKDYDELCLRTDENFLLAVVENILQKNPKTIIIGDAPVNSCIWDKMISTQLMNNIKSLSDEYGVQIIVKDFRKVTFRTDTNTYSEDLQPASDYVIIDVGNKSWLEPITKEGLNDFRVTNYNPEQLSKSHSKGIHKYCITKELFLADLIITLPKIKTHQKTGITNSLKILVGINGDKDYLPHHRKGGLKDGGDCYPGSSILRRLAESILDKANEHQGRPSYKILKICYRAIWELSFPKDEHTVAAAWHGNDTTWRMVYDLNMISLYGRMDGSLSEIPQREIFSLCDGIIGGQGDGPLHPEPLPLGVVALTNDAYFMDIVVGRLFNLKIEKIPMLMQALNVIKNTENRLMINNSLSTLENLSPYSIDVKMPPGWKHYDQK